MEIQNISGADIVSQRLSVDTNISNENARPERNSEVRNQVNIEEHKGTLIDVKA